MKTFYQTLTFAIVLLFAGLAANAQNFSEDFENRVNRSRLQTNFNWSFQGMSINKSVVINDSAICSSPLTASRTTTTGWLYIDGNKTVNFKTRIANLFAVPTLQFRMVALNGTVTNLLNYSYTNTNIQNHTASTGNVTGWYKLEWFWPALSGGNCLVGLDDITSNIPAATSTYLADLNVAMTTDKATYTLGDAVNYTVTVTSPSGPDALQAATVNVTVPNSNEISYVAVTNGTFNSSTGTLSLSNFAKNTTATLTFQAPAGNGSYAAALNTITRGQDYNTANNSVTSSFVVLQPLPVELVTFTGKNTTEGNALTWTTASEKNSHFIAVERAVSENGKVRFEELGRVATQGFSTTKQQYHFTHAGATTHEQYRLRMVDRDGSTEYSPIINIRSAVAPLQFVAYPNPSSDFVNLQASQTLNEVVTLRVVSNTGAVVHTAEYAAGQPLRLSLDNFANGVYRLLVSTSTETKSLTVTKQ